MVIPVNPVFPGRGKAPLEPQAFYIQTYVYSPVPPPSPPVLFVWDLPEIPRPTLWQDWSSRYNLNLIGRDQLPVGAQTYDLTPRAPPPITPWMWPLNPALLIQPPTPASPPVLFYYDVPDPQRPIQWHEWSWKYNQNLIGQDKLPTGLQVYDLVPAQRPPEQIQLHAWTWNYNLNLIGKDRLTVGKAVYDLTPISSEPSPRRSWEYWYNKNLIGKDQLPFRQSDWPNPTLPQPVKDWIQSLNIALTTIVVLPFRQSDWQLTPAAVQPERTITASYNPNLVGKDLLPIRQQDWPNPIPPPLVKDWIELVNLLLTTAPPNIFAQARQQDWPTPRGAEPDWRRSWEWAYNRNLIAQDFLPFRQSDWPLTPAAPQPDRTWVNPLYLLTAPPPSNPPTLFDYGTPDAAARVETWINSVALVLRVAPIATPFNQTDWPNPTQPFRLDQFLGESYNRNLVGQDRLPFRQSDWPTPRDYERAIQLRTWVDIAKLNLVAGPRPFNQTDWPLNFGPLQPDRFYSTYFNLNLRGKDKLPFRQTDWPLPNRGPEQPDRSSVFTDFLFQPPFVPPFIPRAQYFLLQPHYIGTVLIPAWSIITEGIDVPIGWIPTLMVDPLNAQAVQAFYAAGPRPGYPGPGYDWQGPQVLTAQRSASIQSPNTYWVQSGGKWQLTGLGAGLPPVGI